ncbi:hypothetical protein [Sinomicrobium weinanense]|uniref:Secreted protein n=1 Tax=Sinomicrobium weinanense TaxID=2842200 RepID=A0A926Q4Q9_9FLAO|nr:hypothetical protein [Sinomicrobium weinanense]MBC9798249.1 hypothetical protein [Sinomicrobium weinanense]MBU3122646.1 hypothetical protein [Sinomicrobium weinanense]
MRQLVILLIVMGFSASLDAQEMLPKKSIPIRAENSALPNTNTPENNSSIFSSPEFLPSPNLNLNKNNTNSSFDLSTSESDNFMEKEQFLNPGTKYEKRLNRRQGEGEDRGGNYKVTRYLGDFKTKSRAVKIVCRDHEYVDGDRVRIYLNDSIVVDDIVLEGGYKGFDLPLQKGFNKIDFQALNQGTSGPNTAELRIYGDQGELLSANEWLLNTGGKATMIIVKEDDE